MRTVPEHSGLAISLISAFLMLSFPVYATPIFLDEKTGKWLESGEPFEWNPKQVPSWKVWRARLGPILLGLGFFLQIVAAGIT